MVPRYLSPPYNPDPIGEFTPTPNSSQGNSSDTDTTVVTYPSDYVHSPEPQPSEEYPSPSDNDDGSHKETADSSQADSDGKSDGNLSDLFDQSSQAGTEPSPVSSQGERIDPELYREMHRELGISCGYMGVWQPEGGPGDEDDPIEEWDEEQDEASQAERSQVDKQV